MKNKELKTLNDLKGLLIYKDDPTNWISKEELKAEAVKWVKSFKVAGKGGNWKTDNLRKWIKHFFNLTEDDLK